jgi:DNA-binding CsgD family transcriptional regulator
LTATVSAERRLIGREPELETLFGLIDRASERSGALVVCGEPGIGKTALLTAASRRASGVGVRVLSAAGVESEADLAFSGLHQLLLPLLSGTGGLPAGDTQGPEGAFDQSILAVDRLKLLPRLQRDALRTAFGLEVEGAPDRSSAPDRFMVGLAVLNLLSDEAEKRPLLCVLDDAHWLDQASARTLAFVGRRLSAESVVMLFATAEPGEDLRGLPELAVYGLDDDAALELLGEVVHGRLDERVRERILAETRGNPLALTELPRGLSPAELAGGFGVPAAVSDMRSLSGRIEQSFLRRLDTLPAETRLLLLVAAAEPVGDPALLWGAAGRLGIVHEALAPAAETGLLEVGGRVRFRHPLLRSAVYDRASLTDRRRAHRALADATDPDVDPDRRAWHCAQASSGPDEEVAAALEHSAARAQARGGLAAGAAFLERAAGLSLDPALRTRRALAAARAKFEAAAPDAANGLLATAEMGPLDDLQRARLERLRAQIAIVRTGGAQKVPGLAIGPQAPGVLVDAATRLEPLDPELARETYLEALTTAMWVDSNDSYRGVTEAAEAARAAPRGPHPPSPLDVLLDGLAARFSEPYPAALPCLRHALDALASTDGCPDDEIRWLWFACPVTPEPLAPEVWDDETWHELATRAVRLAREAGSLAVLPNALTARATVHVLAGELTAASALIDEAYAISEATGNTPLRYPSFMLAAWRGQEASALNAIETGIQDATARGFQRTLRFTHCATAVLFNGLGRYRQALAAAECACDHEDLGLFGWALSELVEAGARNGSREVASDALDRLAQRTSASGTDWALGIEARSRALLSEGVVAERLYKEAIARLSRTRIRAELARAHLVYGEWLRREKRRVDAREQLRSARDQFVSMGAEAFAERASRELLATGERARQRRDDTRRRLTSNEEQIARLAREGLTDREIGNRLFISSRTVEWHLRNVYAKLGIRSRMELHNALPSPGRDPAHS